MGWLHWSDTVYHRPIHYYSIQLFTATTYNTFRRMASMLVLFARPINSQRPKHCEYSQQSTLSDVPWDPAQKDTRGVGGVVMATGR